MTLLATCWSFGVKWTFSRPCTYCSHLFRSINPLGNFTPCLCVRGLIFYLQYQHLWSSTFWALCPKNICLMMWKRGYHDDCSRCLELQENDCPSW
jgi:hypothetical protein